LRPRARRTKAIDQIWSNSRIREDIQMRMRRHFMAGSSLLLPIVVGLTASWVGVARAQGAQSKDGVTFASAAEIDAAIAKTASGTNPTTRLLPDGTYQYYVAARKQPGSAEIHTQWSDITVIRSGKGVVRTGQGITNKRETAPGEWRGDAIPGFVERTLGAGDLIVIPAGVAHQFAPVGKEPLVYVTVKAPAQTGSAR